MIEQCTLGCICQIAVRFLETGGVNRSEDLFSGPATFIGIMLPGSGGVFGWRPPGKMLDNRSGARDDMVARYIRSDIANVAHNRGSEKRGFAQLLHSGLSSSLRHARQIFVIILDRME